MLALVILMTQSKGPGHAGKLSRISFLALHTMCSSDRLLLAAACRTNQIIGSTSAVSWAERRRYQLIRQAPPCQFYGFSSLAIGFVTMMQPNLCCHLPCPSVYWQVLSLFQTGTSTAEAYSIYMEAKFGFVLSSFPTKNAEEKEPLWLRFWSIWRPIQKM